MKPKWVNFDKLLSDWYKENAISECLNHFNLAWILIRCVAMCIYKSIEWAQWSIKPLNDWSVYCKWGVVSECREVGDGSAEDAKRSQCVCVCVGKKNGAKPPSVHREQVCAGRTADERKSARHNSATWKSLSFSWPHYLSSSTHANTLHLQTLHTQTNECLVHRRMQLKCQNETQRNGTKPTHFGFNFRVSFGSVFSLELNKR